MATRTTAKTAAKANTNECVIKMQSAQRACLRLYQGQDYA